MKWKILTEIPELFHLTSTMDFQKIKIKSVIHTRLLYKKIFFPHDRWQENNAPNSQKALKWLPPSILADSPSKASHIQFPGKEEFNYQIFKNIKTKSTKQNKSIV